MPTKLTEWTISVKVLYLEVDHPGCIFQTGRQQLHFQLAYLHTNPFVVYKEWGDRDKKHHPLMRTQASMMAGTLSLIQGSATGPNVFKQFVQTLIQI